jgi:hypothetical protein
MLVRSIEHRACPLLGRQSTELSQQKLTNGRAFCRAPHNGAAVCPSNSGRFTLSNISAERPHARKITAVGCATRPTRSCRLGILGHLPLSRLVRRRGWPCAGYSGLMNPSSRVFVGWNKISTHQYRQSLDRLLGRAAVVVTRYERIERIVPHRVAVL